LISTRFVSKIFFKNSKLALYSSFVYIVQKSLIIMLHTFGTRLVLCQPKSNPFFLLAGTIWVKFLVSKGCALCVLKPSGTGDLALGNFSIMMFTIKTNSLQKCTVPRFLQLQVTV
jgi:hypothetical protein